MQLFGRFWQTKITPKGWLIILRLDCQGGVIS